FGAPASNDGWRARGTKHTVRRQPPAATAEWSHGVVKSSKHRPSAPADGWASPAVRQVAFEDDIAGPALRTAGRIHHDRFIDGEYRVAQQDAGDAFGDTLRESFERPFGQEPEEVPAMQEDFSDDFDSDADAADQLFDDLPDDTEQRQPSTGYEEPNQEPMPDSLFDDEAMDDDPRTDAEEIAPGDMDDYSDDFSKPFDRSVAPDMSDARSEAMENCSDELAALKANRLNSIDLFIGVTGNEGEDYPFSCSIDDGTIFAPRQWCEVTYMWKASGLCHKPLYFEDIHLERYGHSWGPYVQPLVSGAHFFTSLPILPYKMGLKTPNECVYTLGHYRPGNCAPYLIDPIPFTWRAALFQAGASVGAAAVLP
ncbi:MAG: hypothetical protein AAF266_10185, partial [Planctomycetota bacterium]